MKAHPTSLIWLCFALIAVSCNANSRTLGSAPPSSTGMANMQSDVFGMDSQEYFTDPGKNFSDVGYRMVDAGQQGLLLGGPDYVAYDKVARFPIACLNVADRLELRDHDFRSYALIAAFDVGTGIMYAGQLIEQKFKKEKLDPNASMPPPGISFRGSAGDLFERLEIPRRTAKYLITGILLDRVSNRITVRVGPDSARTDSAPKTS
jgi:hypothetical protein